MSKSKGKRKAISQLIATVLLITLVLVLAAIIFFWVRGFVTEQIEKFGKPIEQICDEVNFDAALQGDDSLYIFNKGNIPISDFLIKTYIGGDSEISRLGGGVSEGSTKLFSLSEPLQISIADAEKVMVIPDLTGYLKGTSKTKSLSCDESTLGKLVKPAAE